MTTRRSSPDGTVGIGPIPKVMQTFRMPRVLVDFLKREASSGQRDLTNHVVRTLDGWRTYFGLPEAATSLLEADRARLGMERYQYLLHLLFLRSIELREHGVGFDAPGEAAQAEPEPPAEPPVPTSEEPTVGAELVGVRVEGRRGRR